MNTVKINHKCLESPRLFVFDTNSFQIVFALLYITISNQAELFHTLLYDILYEYCSITFYTPAPRRGRGVYCFTSVRLSIRPSVLPSFRLSFRPSKIFFVALFSVTVDGRNLIFGHKHHIGIPYCG